MLLDYVRNIAERNIAEKEQRDASPAGCLYREIIEEAKADILECMRTLARNGEYTARITINKEPMLIRNKS